MKIQDTILINGTTYPIIRDMTAEEEQQNAVSSEQQIEALKQQLAESDYKAIKYAEGWLTEEDYAPIKAERQALRDQINDLEGGAV